MKARKTIEVGLIKEFANNQLAHPNNTVEEKLGIIRMIEHVLLKANAYNGFMFLNQIDGTKVPALGTEEWCSRKYF
jgi:hypothetical protein